MAGVALANVHQPGIVQERVAPQPLEELLQVTLLLREVCD
jgi:hypothetical protein